MNHPAKIQGRRPQDLKNSLRKKKKKEKAHLLHKILGSAELRVLRECCVKKKAKKEIVNARFDAVINAQPNTYVVGVFVASAFFSLPPHPACSHWRPSVLPHPSEEGKKKAEKIKKKAAR